jgi:hypothetical protein
MTGTTGTALRMLSKSNSLLISCSVCNSSPYFHQLLDEMPVQNLSQCGYAKRLLQNFCSTCMQGVVSSRVEGDLERFKEFIENRGVKRPAHGEELFVNSFKA